MSKWVGYAVSVNCGEPLGCYQGTILEADGTTITLTKAFRNGFPYPKSQVTLNAADIKDLKIIETRPEQTGQTHSTVAVTKSGKKGQRSTVCENLQANPSSSGNLSNANPVASSSKGGQQNNRGAAACPARSKPIEIQGGRPNKINHAGSYGTGGSTPKGRGAGGCAGGAEKARRRNEACFGLEAAAVDDDFDFEGNLALFDKRALWERMRHTKPDLVRHADDGDAKMRHDENVMGGAPCPRSRARRVVVPAEIRGRCMYEADDGLLLPTITHAARRALYDGMDRLGVGGGALAALVARAACDVALRLVGGGRRLDPSNAHQAPCIVGVVGSHGGGATGACCLRLLAAHGARVALHVASAGAAATGTSASASALLARELEALALDGVRPQALVSLPVPDLVLLALDDPQRDPATCDSVAEQYSEAVWWVRGARAAVVGVEGGGGGVACRARVLGGWPADDPEPVDAQGGQGGQGSQARVYVAALGEPRALLRRLGLPRLPARGSAALPLHPRPPSAADLLDDDDNDH